MSDQQHRGGGEPSMEEILASIRKIISDEGEEKSGAPDAADDEAVAADAPPGQTGAGGATPPAAAEGGLVKNDAEDETDAPAELSEDESLTLDLMAEDEDESRDEAAPRAVFEPDDDILELTEEVDDSSVVDLRAARQQARGDDGGTDVAMDVVDAIGAASDEPDTTVLPEKPARGAGDFAQDEPQDEEPAGMTPDSGGNGSTRNDPIVSDETSTVATAALTELARAANAGDGGGPKSDADRILEQLVREALRPQLKAWLDENLPGLVERIVRSEVRRMSRRAEATAEDEQGG